MLLDGEGLGHLIADVTERLVEGRRAVILVGLSGKIARMPREHKALFLRLSLFGETALTRLFVQDRFMQIARGFWIFCGLLWLVGGLLILLKLSPPITLPVTRS